MHSHNDTKERRATGRQRFKKKKSNKKTQDALYNDFVSFLNSYKESHKDKHITKEEKHLKEL